MTMEKLLKMINSTSIASHFDGLADVPVQQQVHHPIT
jgi:hypothetical protein